MRIFLKLNTNKANETESLKYLLKYLYFIHPSITSNQYTVLEK